MRLSLAIMLGLTMFFVATASPGFAAAPPPEHNFVSDPSWFQQFAWDHVDCGAFAIHETATSGRWNQTVYFDDAGDPVLVFEHYTFSGVIENLSTGKTETDRFDTNFKFQIIRVGDDYTYDIYTAAGTTFRFTLPGQGLTPPTLVGRYVYGALSDVVVFSAGPHPEDVFAFQQFDPVALCALVV